MSERTQNKSERELREMRARDRERMARLAGQDAASVVVANTVISLSTSSSSSSCDTSSSSSSSDCSF